ncbi:hypothetical protein Lal_00045413, partial [Lupinus albus]
RGKSIHHNDSGFATNVTEGLIMRAWHYMAAVAAHEAELATRNIMKKPKRNGTYHRLKEVSDYYCSQSSNVDMLNSPNVKMVQVQQKIRLSTNILKRFRDAYVEGMVCFAENVAHMNSSTSSNICFEKKIHDDDDVQYLTAS